MKRLLNTLYVNQADVYMALDGDNIVLLKGEEEAGPSSAAQSGVHCRFWVYRRQPCVNGVLRGTEYCDYIYDGDRAISRQGHWAEQRQCSAAKKAISCL